VKRALSLAWAAWQVLPDKRVEESFRFVLFASGQARMIFKGGEVDEMFLVFSPPTHVWAICRVVNNNENGYVAMFAPSILQVLRGNTRLISQVLRADDSKANRNSWKFDGGSSRLVETRNVIEIDRASSTRITDINLVGPDPLRATQCIVRYCCNFFARNQVDNRAHPTASVSEHDYVW